MRESDIYMLLEIAKESADKAHVRRKLVEVVMADAGNHEQTKTNQIAHTFYKQLTDSTQLRSTRGKVAAKGARLMDRYPIDALCALLAVALAAVVVLSRRSAAAKTTGPAWTSTEANTEGDQPEPSVVFLALLWDADIAERMRTPVSRLNPAIAAELRQRATHWCVGTETELERLRVKLEGAATSSTEYDWMYVAIRMPQDEKRLRGGASEYERGRAIEALGQGHGAEILLVSRRVPNGYHVGLDLRRFE
jgi:hypothetical protein